MSPTTITVRVAAVDGKFLADDVGGAKITISDANTQEVLVSGNTKGDSGGSGVMCVSQRRGVPINKDPGTASWSTTLDLDAPRRVQVTAWGPVNYPGSANTVTKTTWMYPGRDITAGDGFLLQLPGLICQIQEPATNTTIGQVGLTVKVQVHVAMMCGCPISDKNAGDPGSCNPGPQPWLPSDFTILALIPGASNSPMPLKWDSSQMPTPGQFVGNIPGVSAGIHKMTVVAQQISTGNTGVDFSTFTISPPFSS